MVSARSAKLDVLGPRLSRICTALSGETMVEAATELVPEFSFFEFRLDSVAEPVSLLPALAEFLTRYPNVVAIATCRRRQNGGAFDGTALNEVSLLKAAAEAGAHIVDLSLETAEELASGDVQAARMLQNTHTAVMLSWHDFARTPDLLGVYERMQRFEPDACKIVPTATNLTDSLALLDLLRRCGGHKNLIAMSMGAAGLATRVLGPSYGSLFTFGSAGTGAETAPGQASSCTLRDLYRMDSLSSATQVYGVFGKPIGGSKSPVMLNAAFTECGQDAVYLPLETDDADELLAFAECLPLAGASVTMPLKEQVVGRLSRVQQLAEDLGAANTLMRDTDGTLTGGNTDAAGILEPLQRRTQLEGASILILGAGGAARAAAFVLKSAGASVSICNRTHARAEQLAQEAGVAAVCREQLSSMHFDAILNATPYGMTNQQMAAPIAEEEMQCRIFFDMVYNPLETPLIRIARARGIEVIAGIEMFVTQGAAQFTLWTGLPAPAEIMRDTVLASLQER